MNNGRLWCVVNPTVGIPILLGAVGGTSLLVHHAVLNNTTWVKDFFAGSTKGKVSKVEGSTSPVTLSAFSTDPAYTVSVTPAQSASGEASFVVKVSQRTLKTADAAIK